MSVEDEARTAMRRLIAEDAVGQLRRGDGLMATLGSEGGALKLDWVGAVGRLLASPSLLDDVEAEARDIQACGIRHIIWAGMGGSVLTVRVLHELGFCGGPGSPSAQDAAVAIYPLDSTDPAALNAIVSELATAKGLALTHAQAGDPAFLWAMFRDVMMVGVAMGMTSEEPITHLAWFTELLAQAGLPPAEHLLIMALPGSYLDAFAREHGVPRRPLQPDGGTGTGGRMSAPGTRVFLLPAALFLARVPGATGQLHAVLRRAWVLHDLDLAATQPARHQFVGLAAALSAASREGVCRLLVRMPPGWEAFVSWLEQLMEESLGKGGKGIVVFDDQPLDPASDMLRVRVVAEGAPPSSLSDRLFTLAQPSLASAEPHERLAALAAGFMGWQLSMALFGYLHHIQFAGQPAVENYKARARALRTGDEPLLTISGWRPAFRAGSLTLLAPAASAHEHVAAQPAEVFAHALQAAYSPPAAGYLDVTVNGDAPAETLAFIHEWALAMGNALLRVPVKVRVAPAAYHSTEQSEMDGPPHLVSLRIVARDTAPARLGAYGSQFLHAQAVSTWQAMLEAGRQCFLLVLDAPLDAARETLATFFAQVEATLHDNAGHHSA